MIKTLLNSHSLDLPLDSFKNYFEFNKSFIFYYTCLGRIHDNIIKAAEDIGIQTDSIRTQLDEFYKARNIVIHGKRIPIEMDEIGLIKISVLENVNLSMAGWNDKGNSWLDLAKFYTDYTGDICEKYFDDLMTEVNRIYENFYDAIDRNLKSIPTSLIFVRNKIPDSIFENTLPPSSGSTIAHNIGFDVYQFKESLRLKH